MLKAASLLMALTLIAPCLPGEAARIAIPYVYLNGQQLPAYQLNANFQSIYALANGGLDTTNLATHAGILMTQLQLNPGLPAVSLQSSGSYAWGAGIIADTRPRVVLTSDGNVLFGPGSAAGDIQLLRSAAGTLQLGVPGGATTPVFDMNGGTIINCSNCSSQGGWLPPSPSFYQTSGAFAWAAGVTGNSYPSLAMADTGFYWGDGTATPANYMTFNGPNITLSFTTVGPTINFGGGFLYGATNSALASAPVNAGTLLVGNGHLSGDGYGGYYPAATPVNGSFLLWDNRVPYSMRWGTIGAPMLMHVAPSATVNKAHTLGAAPTSLAYSIRCEKPDHGYAIGDVIYMPYHTGLTLSADEKQVYASSSKDVCFQGIDKVTHDSCVFTTDNWSLIIDAR